MKEGTIIRETRRRYGMSQGDLGGMLGYERSSIANMELGRKSVLESTLAQVSDRLKDTLVAVQICSSCTRGGFLAGIEIPELDKHCAELHDLFHREFLEMDAALEAYMQDVRQADWEQEQKSAQRLLKQALDMMPLLINLALSLNQRDGTYHRDSLRQVNVSVKKLCRRQKEKELSKTTAP